MPPDPTAPLSSRLLDTGHGLIVTFPIQGAEPVQTQNISSSSARAYFFKVLKHQRHKREYRELGTITAGAANALNYDYLGEDGHGQGDDILRLEDDDLKVYHLGFAPRDPNLRVYEKIAAAEPNRATDHGNRGAPDPTEGDDHGFYTSAEIPNRFDPPALSERLAFRNSEAGQFLQFGFMADGQDVEDGASDLLITGRTYQLQPITDPDEQRFMLNQSLLDREDQILRTISVQIGGLFAWELGSALPDDWGAIEGLSRDLVFEGLEQGGSSEQNRRRLEAPTPDAGRRRPTGNRRA